MRTLDEALPWIVSVDDPHSQVFAWAIFFATHAPACLSLLIMQKEKKNIDLMDDFLLEVHK